MIHRLTYRHANHANMHVRGYNEQGTTMTSFDMMVLHGLDRYHLVPDVRVPAARAAETALHQIMQAKLIAHHAFIRAL